MGVNAKKPLSPYLKPAQEPSSSEEGKSSQASQLVLQAKGEAPRLGVNIDHIATLRQLRGTPYPNLIEAAQAVQEAEADQITVHLREDRRHIQDQDVQQLKKTLQIPLNLEMSVAPEIVEFAIEIQPTWACLVPERREELTTEGGLDLERNHSRIRSVINDLKKVGIYVSLFVEPKQEAMVQSLELGAHAVELHTGTYANDGASSVELKKIEGAAREGRRLGLKVHAGHGLDYQNVRPLIDLRDESGATLIEEYNIGHSIICRAAMVGLKTAVREMRSAVIAP